MLRSVTVLLAVAMAAPSFAAQEPQVNVPTATPAGCSERPSQTDWFRDRAFFDPLIADPRAPQMALNTPALSPEFPHSVERGKRFIWDVSVGKEVAILTRSNFTDATRAPGCSGWGIWVDVSFHVLEELGKDPSNPIINTDYRFSLFKLKYERIMKAGSENVAIGQRVPASATSSPSDTTVATFQSLAFKADLFHHESTHLGDEYVIHAQNLSAASLGERDERPFERFNPSYEFMDFSGAYTWLNGLGRLTTIRAGTTFLVPWKWKDGYWSDHTLEPDARPVPKSKRVFEPYMQFEHHWPHNFVEIAEEAPATADPTKKEIVTRTERQRFSPFVSVDLRHRIVYNFYKTAADESEDKQLSVNLLVGMRSWSGLQRFSIKEYFGRVYYGVNPHGQLRSEENYLTAGFGVTFAVGDR